MKILDLKEFTQDKTPVTSTQFILKSGEFDPEGLFSEEIFGAVGSNDRRNTFSFIYLYCEVLHPEMFRILKQLDRRIINLISTENNYIVDENGKLIEDEEEGKSGIRNFKEMFPKIAFRGGGERDKLIKTVRDTYNNNKMFIDRLPVIPPDVRPMHQGDDGEWIIDELNDVYVSLMRKSFQVRDVGGGVLFDLMNYEMQNAVMKYDDHIRAKLGKKEGAIRGTTLGKRVDFSGRGVITPGPELKSDEVGIPLRMAAKMFEPFIIHILTKTDKIDRDQLAEEIRNYLDMELNVESIQKVNNRIRNGSKIPEGLNNIFWQAAEMAMQDRAVICKRDPVLHNKSLQGFKPKLVDGDTLKIPAEAVSDFNADFDGDCIRASTILDVNTNKITTQMEDILDLNIFDYKTQKTKSDWSKITKYSPKENIKIKAIDPNTGVKDWKNVSEFSVHENLEMYDINDPKNRFENFWCSTDHSLLIFDESEGKIRKVSPFELKSNPKGKYLIQEKEK